MKRSENKGGHDGAGFLNKLPQRILQLHGHDNVMEFVLHALSDTDGLSFNRAAYIVDNPDFDCIKGVAGFCRSEAYHPSKDIWHEVDNFSEHMRKAAFNNRVRLLSRSSFKRAGMPDTDMARELAHDLGMEHYDYCVCNAKHDNRGVLLFEPTDDASCKAHDHDTIENAAHLLGMCPIF